MNNLLSYCGLVDARRSGSEKDLPVHICPIGGNIWDILKKALITPPYFVHNFIRGYLFSLLPYLSGLVPFQFLAHHCEVEC
jgi:hypothetical protein